MAGFFRFPQAIPTYPSSSFLPASAPDGSLAVTIDTDSLYVFDAAMNSWILLASPGGGGGVTTIGTIDSQSKSANGGVISGTSLYYQTADATHPGLLSLVAQEFVGDKTFNNKIIAGSGSGAGTLVNNGGTETLDFQNGVLLDLSGVNAAVWINRYLLDSTGQFSAQWDNRLLLDSSGTDSVNWQDRTLRDIGAGTSINWGNRILADASSISLDWSARQGIYTDGTTATLDWGQQYLNDTTGALSVDWTNRLLKNGVTSYLSWAGGHVSLPQLTASTGLQLDASKNIISATLGTLTETTSSVLTLSSWANATFGSPTITVKQASGSQSGYLSSTDWTTFNNKTSGGITALTGDVTASGPGSVAATLAATSNSTLTTLSGLTTASSLASVGTITSGTWNGTTVAVAHGGTGQTSLTIHDVLVGNGTSGITQVAPSATAGVALVSAGSSSDPAFGQLDVSSSSAVKNALAIANGGTGQTTQTAAFDALQPMTTGGDIIYGGASGTGTRLANGSAGQFLKSNGTTLAPSWAPVSVTPPSTIVVVSSGNGFGSTNTTVRRFSTTNNNGGGSDITYADSAGNGGSFTINTAGTYAITYSDILVSGRWTIAITVNGASLTTNPESITYANGLRAMGYGPLDTSGSIANCSITLPLNATDVIRAQATVGAADSASQTSFSIARVS